MNRQDFYDGKLFDAYRYMGAHKDGDKIRFCLLYTSPSPRDCS